jgi:transposase
MSQVTVITGPERRRRWPVEERLRILEAALAPGAVVADVARQFDVCTSLIYKWRREARGELPGAFMPVTLKEDPGAGVPRCPEPALLVELAGGVRVAVGAHAPAALVNAVLKALRR